MPLIDFGRKYVIVIACFSLASSGQTKECLFHSMFQLLHNYVLKFKSAVFEYDSQVIHILHHTNKINI